jgi:hypothetical protein
MSLMDRLDKICFGSASSLDTHLGGEDGRHGAIGIYTNFSRSEQEETYKELEPKGAVKGTLPE